MSAESSTAIGLAIALVVGAGVLSCGQSSSEQNVLTPSQSSTPAAEEDWQVLGVSVQGRPIRTLTLGHGQRKVLFIGGIHGDEPEGSYSTARLPASFEAAGLADAVTLTILEDVNPDGRAAAKRDNANGVDINRNFPASNFDTTNPAYGGTPLSQPESRLLFDLITRLNPALVLVAHSWVDREFVNFDGPARQIAERFSADSGMPLTPSNDFAPTPGSLGSYVGRDRRTPVVTIEFRKGSDPKSDWERIRSAVLNAIAG